MQKEQDSRKSLPTKYRRPPKAWRVIALILPGVAIIVALIYVFHLVIFGQILMQTGYLYLLEALFLPLIFIWTPIRQGADTERVPWYDALLACLSFGIPFYFYLRAFDISLLGWSVVAPLHATVLAAILWAVLIEAVRRAISVLFAAIILIFSLYPLYGFIMPGMLASTPFSLARTVNFHILSETSMMGIPIYTFATILLGFMVLAIGIQFAGAGKLFNNLAQALLRQTRGGTAKVAIVASGLFGTITGSPVANVVSVGAITIPAMKRAGFPPHFAGAIEACASTGSSLMPPIMGAAAFIMAELLQVPYYQVAIAAFVPSLLYYGAIFMQIDMYAGRVGLKPGPVTEAPPKIHMVLLDNLHIFASVFVLVYLLFAMGWVQWSPWIATVVLFATAMVRKKTRVHLRDYLNFIESLGRVLGDLAGILAAVGLLIGAFILTGIAYSFPYLIVSLAHGNIYLMLFLGAIAAFILGMGVPIIACYIFMALVLAPGLIQGGLDPMAAHMFVLYWAMISSITPPVAIAVFPAALLAEADVMKTGWQAARLAISIYIVPFIFALNPALILHGTPLEILTVILASSLGLAAICGGLEKYLWGIGRLTIASQVLLFIAGILLVWPSLSLALYGAGILVVLYALCYLLRGQRSYLKIMVKAE